ncbi:hypothetical protein GCM10022295_64520 [Streptomyces osmaniensis]|uniref:Uncharacterized protein n=1 Tax=Streptomyces osmaniensis TaxID=593134 RepID=A0ABP6XYQ0_9ACTN
MYGTRSGNFPNRSTSSQKGPPDPAPETGGTDSGVTYILFKNSRVSPIENHSTAVSTGDRLAKEFITNN